MTTTRTPAPTPIGRLAVPLLAVTLALVGSACSSDTEPSTPGPADAETSAIELRNLSVDAVLTGATPDDASSAYGNATLTFTALNTADTESDTLVDITSSAAESVRIDATDEQREIEPGTTIAAGQPVENTGDAGTDQPFTVEMNLEDGELAPGTSIPVTFEFERAGSITVDAPFEVYEAGQLSDTARPLPPSVTPGS